MSIQYCSDSRTFYLDGKDVTYAFCINMDGYAEHLYFGSTIGHDSLTHVRGMGTTSAVASPPGKDVWRSYNYTASEISFFGCGDYREPCVQILTETGDRICELLYDGHEILDTKPPIPGMPSMSGGETLVLHLKDAICQFRADLYYTVYDDANVIARRIVYINESSSTIQLLRAYSFTCSLPGQEYDVLSLYGGWARERYIDRIPLHHGVVSIDSKRATSSAALNPFLALLEGGATESHGDAYGFSLVYSSSYVLKAEGMENGNTLITGGIQDFDFSWRLTAGESFATPEIVIAYSPDGIGGMSREYHDAYRNHLINPRYVMENRPLVLNHWEGTSFRFTYEKLAAIVDAVDGTGIDTFVMDDGWFGKRDDDTSGLGDWTVNETKMPGGLKRIIDHVHEKGMKFGLWFEPEMISEDSDLYRAHPDYAIGVPGRPRSYSRHQFMLDLTRADVRDYIVEAVNSILHQNQIEYVKWDYNRNVTEFYSLGLPPEQQQEFSHRYALGLYDLCERIVEANPHIFFEGCSGGGARFDPAMLHYFPQIWTSDNTDAEDRTCIQYGTSIVYPLSAMSCHVSKPRRPTTLDTRAHIAQLGATGYELDTTYFTDEDRAAVARQVEEYHATQELIIKGDLYRLDTPMDSNFFTEMVVSKDKNTAIVVCYRRMGGLNMPLKRIRLQGLDPNKTYFVRELNRSFAGSTLMHVGIAPGYGRDDFACTKFHIEVR